MSLSKFAPRATPKGGNDMSRNRIFWRWFRNIKAAPGDRKEAELKAGPEFKDDRPLEEQQRIAEHRQKEWDQAQAMGENPFEDPFDPDAGKKKS
jgi:hypothetical protein